MQAPTLIERIKDAVEPDIGIATVVNDGSIYLALSTWCETIQKALLLLLHLDGKLLAASLTSQQ